MVEKGTCYCQKHLKGDKNYAGWGRTMYENCGEDKWGGWPFCVCWRGRYARVMQYVIYETRELLFSLTESKKVHRFLVRLELKVVGDTEAPF